MPTKTRLDGTPRNRGKSKRELKAIDAVACPACHAARGELCRRTAEQKEKQPGRLFVCAERRLAWQMIRDGEIRDETEIRELGRRSPRLRTEEK